ncbi:MAG: HAD family hydrolase [Myxococcota bacterium]|jgi:putative phosphoserine phosphatase/1-acylglycerol-3-phosphate O-acyltransferase|nr:HAD family hydrolase [Myxococcota bacterium]
MDHTIISESSASIYMRHAWRCGDVGVVDMVRGLAGVLQYMAGRHDLTTWTANTLAGLAGRDEASMIDEGLELFEREMAPKVYPAAARLIEEHLASDHLVVIVTGSIPYLVEPLAQSLGIEHVLCTQLEIRDGVLTGQCIEPICLEAGKVDRMRGFIEEHDVDLARSYFYSDSITDLPALEVVGHPVATNPDSALYRMASRRGWPVRLFDAPRS